MTDFTLLKIAADHAIKAKGTLLADAATINFNSLATPEAVQELACAHEQLKAENEALRNMSTACDQCSDSGRLSSGDACLKCYAMDAKRYRWLRDDELSGRSVVILDLDSGSYYENMTDVGEEELDELIDAAMGKEAGE